MKLISSCVPVVPSKADIQMATVKSETIKINVSNIYFKENFIRNSLHESFKRKIIYALFPKLYDFRSSMEHKRRGFEECSCYIFIYKKQRVTRGCQGQKKYNKNIIQIILKTRTVSLLMSYNIFVWSTAPFKYFTLNNVLTVIVIIFIVLTVFQRAKLFLLCFTKAKKKKNHTSKMV